MWAVHHCCCDVKMTRQAAVDYGLIRATAMRAAMMTWSHPWALLSGSGCLCDRCFDHSIPEAPNARVLTELESERVTTKTSRVSHVLNDGAREPCLHAGTGDMHYSDRRYTSDGVSDGNASHSLLDMTMNGCAHMVAKVAGMNWVSWFQSTLTMRDQGSVSHRVGFHSDHCYYRA